MNRFKVEGIVADNAREASLRCVKNPCSRGVARIQGAFMISKNPKNLSEENAATSTLEQELADLISHHLIETSADFSANSDLYEAGLDSMAIMQLLILVEERYAIRLSEADVTRDNFSSVAKLASLLAKYERRDLLKAESGERKPERK